MKTTRTLTRDDIDVVLLVHDPRRGTDARYASILVNTVSARTLSREADAFFRGLPPLVTLMQNDGGGYGFSDTDEVVASGEAPAMLSYPDDVARFLGWMEQKWNAKRPVRLMEVDRSSFAPPEPRPRSRLREAPRSYTRRGRR